MDGIYLLFAGTAYYPDGGWGDFRGVYATVNAARAAFDTRRDDEFWHWYDIVDVRSWQCVETAGERYGFTPETALPE